MYQYQNKKTYLLLFEKNLNIKIMNMDGYRTKEYGMPVKRYCQTMDLKDSPELIAKYIEAHDRDHFWKEIEEGIKAVGILEMEVYILGNRIVMIVDAPLDFDWDSAMARLATLPRQDEWERFVSQFQNCSADATSDEKWQMMTRIFSLS